MELLRNKIQEKENIILYFQFPVARMKAGKISSDGNRVNVGNFDSNGFNVNNNWDDNRNDALGLSSARTSFSIKVEALSFHGALLLIIL